MARGGYALKAAFGLLGDCLVQSQTACRSILVELIREDFLGEGSFLEQVECRPELIQMLSQRKRGKLGETFASRVSQLPAKLVHQNHHFPQGW